MGSWLKWAGKSPFVTVLLAFISMGGVAHIFGLYELNLEREDSYIQLYKQEMQDHSKTRREFSQLKADLAALNGNVIHIPFPYWIKDRDSRIVYLNDAYEEEILRPLGLYKADVLGTIGEAMFDNPMEIETIISNDQQVLRLGKTIAVSESVKGKSGTSWKFPIYKDGYLYLMGGVWISECCVD